MIELVAVVAELVDALDSKSSSLLGSVGSIPTDGITFSKRKTCKLI